MPRIETKEIDGEKSGRAYVEIQPLSANSTERRFGFISGGVRIESELKDLDLDLDSKVVESAIMIMIGVQPRSFQSVQTVVVQPWGLVGEALSSQGHPVHMGEAVLVETTYAGARERVKHRLESTVCRLVDVPFGDPETGKITPRVADAAKRFLALLPYDVVLPKIAPDHEGDLLLVWEGTSPELIVTLEARRLHFVVNPGASDAQYFDDLEFAGDRLPTALLSVLPKTRA